MTASVRSSAAHSLPLLGALAAAFERAGVVYCQWKGHWKRERWLSGEGDVDLLVARESLPGATEGLRALGFRLMLDPLEAQIPGMAHYWGYDAGSGHLVHVHLHTRVLLGDPVTGVYRLPIESEVLEGRASREGFPVPEPAVEYGLFVLRAALRHTWTEVLRGQARARLTLARAELAYLEARCDPGQAPAVMERLVPAVPRELFLRCRASLDTLSTTARIGVGHELRRRLADRCRRPPLAARLERLRAALARRLRTRAGRVSRARLADGGAVVAIVGADGAGKSTGTRAVASWLAPRVRTRAAHLGRPPRSFRTLWVGAALKVARALGPLARPLARRLELLRYVCTAWDRYRLACAAARFAADGGVALCERYPVSLERRLAGPQIATLLPQDPPPAGFAARMAELEADLYRRLPPPDGVIVLQVPPDVAVARKTDEPADYVRARANIVWRTDWSGSGAVVVDAGRTLPSVLRDLKAAVWAAL